jgi:hypothetical protein
LTLHQDIVMPQRSRLAHVRRLLDDRILHACEQLRTAMRQKERLVCLYDEQVLVICPQLLGHRPEGPYVLAFVVAGDAATAGERARSPRRWRWLPVADMWGLFRTKGPWISAPRHTRPPLEDLTVELDSA